MPYVKVHTFIVMYTDGYKFIKKTKKPEKYRLKRSRSISTEIPVS